MRENELVTIGLLTYNHEDYIEDALGGILAQDYENIELIILDDASTDRTVEVIDSYRIELEKRFVRVLDISNGRNCGNIPHNLNRMIKKAKGKFIKLIAGDDILAPKCISSLKNTLLAHPECGMAYGNGYYVDDNYKNGMPVDITRKVYLYRKSGVETGDMLRKLMMGNFILAPSVMMDVSIYRNYGLYDETIPFEDYEFWLRICKKTKFYYVDQCLVFYRRGDNAITNYRRGDREKIRNAIENVGVTMKKYYRYLSEEDKISCKASFYQFYLDICKENRYVRGSLALLYQMKKQHLPIVGRKRNPQDLKGMLKKKQSIIALLEKWVLLNQGGYSVKQVLEEREFHRIAIYGLGCVGNLLCKELDDSPIEVVYIIDNNAEKLSSNYSIYTMNHDLESLDKVDVIIVTPFYSFEEIKQQLNQRIEVPVLSIEEILE